MIYDLLDLYDVKSGMGNKSRNDFDPNKYENQIVMFKEIFNNSKLPDKNKLSTTVNLKQGELERFDVKFGDVLLTSSSETPNELAMSSVALRDYPNTVYSGFSKRLRPITHLTNPQYMRYWFRSRQFRDYIDSTVSMTTRANLNMAILSAIKIDLPDLNTQKAISNILSSLDDKIEINNKINKNLEELAQTLYKRWFVDFEFPNENGEPYKSNGGEMVESEFGPIPKEWGLSNLLEIADYMNGIAVKKYAADEGEISIPVLKIKELGVGNVTSDSDRCNLSVPEKYIIKKGDLIFSWSGTLLVDFWTGSTSVLNQHLFKVSSNKYPRWFYYYWTKYHLEKFQNIAKSMATTMGHIKRDDLSKSLVVIPVNNHLEQGSIILEPIIDEILKLRIQNNKLSRMRDELLPKLINGEIEVPIEE